MFGVGQKMGIRQLLTLAGDGCFDRSLQKNRYLVKIGPHSEIQVIVRDVKLQNKIIIFVFW